MRRKRITKDTVDSGGKRYRLTRLDEFFTPEEVSRDVFGFLDAICDSDVEGFFAVFDLDGMIRATQIYSKEILEEMVIPDVLKDHPEAFYRIFPESEFDRVVKKTV